MTAIRVLLADDHPPLRAGVRARLEQEPDIAVVGETGDGREALRLALELRPHVVVLDMQMPGLSGIEVARRLYASDTPVRVLALTAYGDAQHVASLLDTGAAGYLTKEESLETIVAAVRGIARGEEGWLSRSVTATLVRQRRSHADDPAASLSEREREVLRLVALGDSNQQIGEKLFIAESTVKKHINSIYAKLEIGARAEAAAWAWKNGFVRGDDV